MKLIAAMAIAIGLSACASVETGPARPAGSLPAEYRASAEQVLASGLRDPRSAIFDHREAPYILTCDRGVFGNQAIADFWAVEVWVNARNGYGGYTGPQPYTVVFIPDEVTGEMTLRAQVGQGGGRMVSYSGICRR